MAWRFEHSARSPARKEDVWRRYVDVSNWSDWSTKGVESSHLDGQFEVGAEGKSKPPGLPARRFRLIAVEPDAMFASAVKLPGARLAFEHVIDPLDSGVRITHRANLSGPLAFLYVPLVRKAIEQGLPDGVERLGAMAAEG